MLDVDLSSVWSALDISDLMGMEGALAKSHRLLKSGRGAGGELTGWLRLPGTYDIDALRKIESAAEKIRGQSKTLLVIGAGGSGIAARAILELLDASSLQIIFTGDHLSARAYGQLTQFLEKRDFSINLITKSGRTLESALAFRFYKRILEHRYGMEAAKGRIYVTTDPGAGPMRQLADMEGYATFSIPSDIPSSFGALTAAGLLPAAAGGLDIKAIVTGAVRAMDELSGESLDNPAWQYAAVRNLLYEKGKKVEILTCCESGFRQFGRWWQQLFAAAEGKDSRGVFPVAAQMPSDSHVLGQYIFSGERMIFETALRFDPEPGGAQVEVEWQDIDGLNYLAGKTIGYIEQQFSRGMTAAHENAGVPVTVIHAGARRETELGALMYFMELSAALSAYLLGLNPFEKRAADAGKARLYQWTRE